MLLNPRRKGSLVGAGETCLEVMSTEREVSLLSLNH